MNDVNNEEFRKALEHKADMSQLLAIESLKSNKVDTETAFKWINILHK